MPSPPPKTPDAEKNLTYYPAWLKELQTYTDQYGAITNLSNHVAKKRGKEMKNIRPVVSKIVKGHRTASPEYLLIIQEWMNNQNPRTGN